MPNSGRRQTGARGFWLLGGVVVAAAVVIVGYFGISGRQPADDVTGAIGAAKKHIEEQIGDDDVILAETQVHDFMQSETFQKMVDDADFRKAVMSRYIGAAIERAIGVPEHVQLPTHAADRPAPPVLRDKIIGGDAGDIIAGLDATAINRLGELVERELAEAPNAKAGELRQRIERRIGEDVLLRGELNSAAMRRFGDVVERALGMPEYRQLPTHAVDRPAPPVMRDRIIGGDASDIIAGLEMSDAAVNRLGELVERELAGAPNAKAGELRELIERRIGEDALLRGEFDAAAMRRFGDVVERALGMPEYRQLPPQAMDPLNRPVFRGRGPMTPGDIDDVIAHLEVQARSASGPDGEALQRLLENPLFTKMIEHPGFVLALESGAITNRLEQRAAIQ